MSATATAALHVRAKGFLSYAMAHNQLPVVDQVEIHNMGAPRLGCTLVVEIRDAEGLVGSAHRQSVDLADDARTVVNEVRMRLDPSAMLQLDERRPGELVVRLEDAGEVVATETVEVQLLPAKHWLASPFPLALEMLAAFVMPNDPAVELLLRDASALLQQRTGSPSLEGYQSGPDRVDAIVDATFSAMQARHIRYSEPPASWGQVGQKVRTPADVLDGHIGTCLDTTVVLAAALEQAGVRPQIWVVEGHAFLGYWREERALDSIVQTEVADVVNLVDLGLVQLVETTMVTAGSEPQSFSSTHRPPYAGYLTGDLERVVGVIDVHTARTNGLVPLPARRHAEDGVEVFEYKAGSLATSPLPAPAPGAPAGERRSQPAVPARVQQWKNTLLDLSLRNRLINFTERASLELRVPDGQLALLEDQLQAHKPLALLPADKIDQVHAMRGGRSGWDLPEDQLTNLLGARSSVFVGVASGAYATRMRGIAHKARTIVEETGANNLYLALGTLVWELDGRVLRSPLILVPVRLAAQARSQTYRLELDDAGAVAPNYCLLEKLRQSNGLELPGLENLTEDDYGVDVGAAMQSVRRVIAEKGLGYRVEDTASLSILQFAKFRLWKDLDDHWSDFLENPLVKHLVETPNLAFDDPVGPDAGPDLDALDAECPIPADASQLEAIHEAVRGRSFVLEGPPGTGKSQTITNLLTRAVASGKRVLFVAEKRAALDVVFTRLDSVGMRPFCLDLHDKGSKPNVVRAQVKLALDHAVGVDSQGLSAQQEVLRSSRRNLARYATRLHEENSAGLSYYSARTSLLALGEDEPALDVDQGLLARDQGFHAQLLSALRDLPDSADSARPRAGHPWGFSNLVEDTPDALDSLHASARRVDLALDRLPVQGAVGHAAAAIRGPGDAATLAGITGSVGHPLAVLDQARTAGWQQMAAGLRADVAAFGAASHPGLDRAAPDALGLPLEDVHAQAVAAAGSGFFGRKKRLRAVLDQLAPVLRPGAAVEPKQVPELAAALVQVQAGARALAARAQQLPGVTVPATWNPLTPDGLQLVDQQVAWLSWAAEQVREVEGPGAELVARVRTMLEAQQTFDGEVTGAFDALAQALQQLVAAAGARSEETLRAWSGAPGLAATWVATRADRSLDDPGKLSLRRWTAFVRALEPLRTAGALPAYEVLRNGTVHADDAAQAWERGLARSSVAERARSTGLDGFDPVAHDKTVQRFSAASTAVRRHMAAEVPRQVLENRPFHPGAARGQVGALQRELAKQRRGLGVRALLATYGELITQVMPCVLVSPDSVSRFFPVGSQKFDLVVFDEASQIRVADAVGAMGRATSVVVVGDSKQMPPTTFGESSAEDGEPSAADDLAVEDQESILSESVQAGVDSRWLSWHYRSQDESLIAFSNRFYYEDRLSSFPAPIPASTEDRTSGFGVSLRRVNGEFLRSGSGKLLRTNPIEAEAIVAEIRARFDASPASTPSVGVVTFNQQQRAYIEALVRDSGDERLVDALDAQGGEGLFVKNLENVQGDERDVVLFSTAFSVNAKGVLPLNFGPLTRAGGERRLNVAVTRARRQVMIFSSFEPGQLRAEETQSLGIKHLRAYLDMAASGPAALDSTGRPREQRADRHRDELAAALGERGLVVETNVGLSEFKIDLTIASPDDPGRPLVAVLLDGEGWARRRTVGDRDGLPVQVLGTMLRWPAVERVWMPAWLADPVGTVDRLEKVSREALSRPTVRETVDLARADQPDLVSVEDVVGHAEVPGGREAPAAAPAALPVPLASAAPQATRPADPPARLVGEETFVAWVPQRLGVLQVLDDLPSPRAALLVRKALEVVIAAEGPVSHDRLGRLVAAAFGLSRARSDRMAAILAHLPTMPVPEDPGFAWPPSVDPAGWKGFRRAPADDPRPVEQVSLVEIGNAMASLCAAYAGMEESELMREALAVLGGKRLTTSVRQRLSDALHLLENRGRVRRDPSGLYFAVQG